MPRVLRSHKRNEKPNEKKPLIRNGPSEFPEAELLRGELNLRKLDLPQSVTMTKRSLLRWVCLSIGLVSEKESRRIGIEVIDALFYFLFSEKKKPTADQIRKYLEEKKGIKTSERLVRYHLQKMLDINLIERKNGCYCINSAPNAEREDFVSAVEYHLRNEFEQSIKQIILGVDKLVEKYRI
ncbi:MAG: hypothetical protein N3F05_01030 [Candidatus Diapherotrites archaeon]|nr:hypothetical protein [Candidatus Diapherotrites archaeon]